jgi:Fe-S oxidoreductase
MEDFRKRIREDCLENEEAFCISKCPFSLDVREFAARIARNAFNSAYRMYSNAVGFPGIVSVLCGEPCGDVCPRRSVDRSVNLRMLEAAAVRYASNRKPNNYSLPAKGLKIAIIGGGPGGLACALRLANKKYDVSVFDRNDAPGGALAGLMDPGAVARELELQFMYERYDFVPRTDIRDVESLISSFSAVYISTGIGGDDFGLMEKGLAAPFATRFPGVFMGGEITGALCAESIAHGLRAAILIESYLKTGLMKGFIRRKATRMILDPAALVRTTPVEPANGAEFSEKEASLEAARCVRCKCDACIRHCRLLSYHEKHPKRLEEEIEATINPGTLDGNGTIVTRFISTCNQCGLCEKVCPIGIDIGEVLRASHSALNRKGAMPWAFHEYWLRDMDFANGSAASLIFSPKANRRSEYLFFPGCQLGASNPGYVTSAYEYIRGKKNDTGIALMCCGAPAVWAGEDDAHAGHVEAVRRTLESLGNPKVITACPTCAAMFERYMPENETVMLYDIMAEWGVEAKRNAPGEIISVFDPCSARNRPETCENVRKILGDAGFFIEPLAYEKELAQCCSWGGQISIAAPNYSKRLTQAIVKENSRPYVVYCSNCRDIFAGESKPVKHILDVIFGLSEWTSSPPTASQRRRNRVYLKRTLVREDPGEGAERDDEMSEKLLMDGAVREKLNKNRLLEEDILSVIEKCEASGEFAADKITSHRFGCGVVGNLTHWVEYYLIDGGYKLINAYSHRMAIEHGIKK